MAERREFMKVRSVRLVATDDPGYLADSSAHAAGSRSYAPRGEVTAAARSGHVVEEAARAWLASRSPLVANRILEADVLRWGARAYSKLFIELDAVVGAGAPEAVFEIKWTSSPASITRGLRQASRAADLLSRAYPGVRGGVLFVEADRDGSVEHYALEHAVDLATEPFAWPGDRRVTVFRLPQAMLEPFLDDAGRELLEAARDEADAQVAARGQRRLDREAAAERGDEPLPVLRARKEDVLAYGDADDGFDSPFGALRAMLASVR